MVDPEVQMINLCSSKASSNPNAITIWTVLFLSYEYYFIAEITLMKPFLSGKG